jgi:hypothetical protein
MAQLVGQQLLLRWSEFGNRPVCVCVCVFCVVGKEEMWHVWYEYFSLPQFASLHHCSININLKESCVLYIGQAHRYPPNTPFYVFFQQIYVLHTLLFFSSKCRLFHNATFFGSCIIRILHTVCAKIQTPNSGVIMFDLDILVVWFQR